jgi:hypothetical protein
MALGSSQGRLARLLFTGLMVAIAGAAPDPVFARWSGARSAS